MASVDTEGGLYDFAVANIVADIIIRMAPDIGGYLKKGAHLITSGIIERYADGVREAMCAHGFELVEEAMESDWVAMVYKKL